MKYIKKILISTLFMLLAFFIGSNFIFAEGDSVEPVIDLIDIPQHYVEHKKKPSVDIINGDSGEPYYKISVKVAPSDNFELYLLADKININSNNSNTYTLCHLGITIVPGYPYKLTFDSSPEADTCMDQLSDSEFFKPGFIYNVYVSDSPNGQNIAKENSFGDGLLVIDNIPEFSNSDQMSDVSFSEILPQEKNNKKFFRIKGEVLHEGKGNLHFYLLKDFGSEEIKIATIPYKKSFFDLPQGNNIQDLAPGAYSLLVKDDSNATVVSLFLKTKITGDGFIQNDVVLNTETDSDQKSLVSRDCGYSPDGEGPGMFNICGFQDAMNMLNRIINFIFALVLPIAAIIFVYVGFLYISSAANPNKREIAKKAIGKLVLGIFVIMIAWILIKTILYTLGVGDGYIFLGMRN